MTVRSVDWSGLLAAFPDDAYLQLRGDDPGTIRRAAVSGSTWSTRTRSQYWESDWVMMFSASADAEVRADETAEHLNWHMSFPDGSDIGGMTFTDDTEVPSTVSVAQTSAWSWFWTDATRANVESDRDVVIVEHHDGRLLPLLAHSATASHERDGVVPDVWFGLEVSGELACVAAVNVNGNTTYLQSVVTHGNFRRRGLARRVCSHATAWSLRQVPYATLGMMTDNDIAAQLYMDLGYVCDKKFRSVRFAQEEQQVFSLADEPSPHCGD